MSTVVKANPEIIWRKMNEEAVLLNPQSGGYFGLNSVGSAFWEKVDGERTLDEIVEMLLQEYDVERSVLSQDIEALVKNLIDHGLLIRC